MENQGLNQLPEADSLPDGFVDSPSEPLAPQTPNSDQEKVQKIDYKDELVSNQEKLQKIDYKDELVSNDFDANAGGGTGKTQKLRTFPVPLSETDGPEESVNSVEGGLVMPVSEAAFGVVKGEINEESQSTERSVDRGLLTNSTPLQEISSPGSVDLLQNKKTEMGETKRKNPKRGFISEKEVLELSLGYQHVLAERDAAISVRDKLESLCRELQRQNKMLMDECKRVSTEGQNLRLDLSTKFQDAIQEVSVKLEEQKNESLAQLKENEMLRTKLKQLADQYALSEQQYSQMLKQKSLELQLSELRIKQHEEKLSLEQAQMKEYAEQVSQLLATEKNLRLQLTTDSEKFQQFQDALLKSNEVFETFKQEIEKMSKSIKELKKENVFLRNKCEKSDITLIELVEERERLKKQMEKTRNQKEKLESLCRSLQAERKQSSIGSGGSADSVAALLPQTILPS